MFGYRVPDPDEVMLVSGRKATQEEPFRIYRQGKFIIPVFSRVKFLGLAQYQATIKEPCTTKQGIGVEVAAVVAFRVAADDKSIYAAGQRFLDDQKVDRRTGVAQMTAQTGQCFAGHLRSIVGAMTLQEMIQNRQSLAEQVLDGSQQEMAKMGLEVDSFQLISVGGSQAEQFIAAMAAPHTAQVQQEAAVAKAAADQAATIAQAKATQASQIAQAEAEQLSEAARQDSIRKQADAKRQTLVVQAQYQAEVDKENKVAEQAGPLATAKAQQSVLAEQEILATRQASLREAQLQTEVIRPAKVAAEKVRIDAEAAAQAAVTSAEAEAKRTIVQADADAHKMQVQAASMAAEGKVTLERALIDQLPQLVESASRTLQGANVTLFNGAEGANQLVTSALTQGLSVFNTIRDQVNDAVDRNEIRKINDVSALTDK